MPIPGIDLQGAGITVEDGIMKSQYVEISKKLTARIAYWEKLLDVRWIRVTQTFIEGYNDEDHHTIADTEAFWQYRHAKIRWYLPAAMRLNDMELDESIVHEYVHVFLSPIEGKIPNRYEEMAEFTVESLAKAIIAVQRVSERKA